MSISKQEFYATSYSHAKERSPLKVRFPDAMDMGIELDGIKQGGFWKVVFVDWKANTATLEALS